MAKPTLTESRGPSESALSRSQIRVATSCAARSSVSGSTEGRVVEYLDNLHEHFVDPCIVKGAAYVVPTAPGYSAQMHAASVAHYAFPTGTYWSERLHAAGPAGPAVHAAGLGRASAD